MSKQTDNAFKFFFLADGITFKGRNKLKIYLASLFKNEGKSVEFINFIFCSDDYLLGINKNYLKHNFYTDIITFDLSDKGKMISAEVYISIDRVRDNAQRLGVTLKSELHRVIFHGALHLCGYADKTKEEKLEMRRKEDMHLKKYRV